MATLSQNIIWSEPKAVHQSVSWSELIVLGVDLFWAEMPELCQDIVCAHCLSVRQDTLYNMAAAQTASQDIVVALHGVLIEIGQDIFFGIDETTVNDASQDIFWSVGDPSPIIRSLSPSDILIDGVSVRHRVSQYNISSGNDSTHNDITIKSSDWQLYDSTNPTINAGTHRITVIAGGRVFYFLLEERRGDVRAFELWGRSMSARDDATVEISINGATAEISINGAMAITDAISAAGFVNPVTWGVQTWVLPPDFSFSGTPVQLLVELAAQIGAVVRASDTEGIRIRPFFQVRPVDMANAGADFMIADDDILDFSFSRENGDYRESTTVRGYAPPSPTISIELEPPVEEGASLMRGDDCYLRIYYDGEPDSEAMETFATAGRLRSLGLKTEIIEEAVEFVDGVGATSKPISLLKRFRWYGKWGGDVNYTKYSTELWVTASAINYSIGIIKYTTVYRRFRLTGHNVSTLLAVFPEEGTPAVSASVQTSATPGVIADGVDARWLTDMASVIARGTAEHDRNAYDREKISLTIPFHADAVDGNIAYVDAWTIGITGNFMILSADIETRGPKTTNQLEMIRCLI